MVVIGERNSLAEHRIDSNKRSALDQPAAAEILEPFVWALNRIHFSFAVRGGLDQCGFRTNHHEVPTNHKTSIGLQSTARTTVQVRVGRSRPRSPVDIA